MKRVASLHFANKHVLMQIPLILEKCVSLLWHFWLSAHTQFYILLRNLRLGTGDGLLVVLSGNGRRNRKIITTPITTSIPIRKKLFHLAFFCKPISGRSASSYLFALGRNASSSGLSLTESMVQKGIHNKRSQCKNSP